MHGGVRIYSNHFMKTQSIENRSNWISILSAIVLACGCLLLRFQIQEVDNNLFMHLTASITEIKGPYRTSPPLLDLLFTSVECGVAILIGCNLAAVPRCFAFIQLFVLSMISQWLLYSFFSIAGHPLSTAFSVAAGGLLGYLFRRIKQRDERFANQYYELSLRNRELQEARLQLVKQDEVERRMLAADLHDQVLNDLKELKQSIEGLDPALPEQSKHLLERAISDVREVMDSLCPSALEHLGLSAAIEDCCRRGAQRAGFKLRFKGDVDVTILERLSIVERSLLYRLVQESLTNVCKHAQASKVWTNLSMDGNLLTISIADDGKGFSNSSVQRDSRGIKYMRLRADLIGATVSWRSNEENKGTIVEIRKEIFEKNGHPHTHS